MQKKNEEVQDSLNKVVFYCSATLILLFSIITILFNEQANLVIINILNWVSRTFSWYYLLAATLYLVLLSLSPAHVMAKSNLVPNILNPNSAC